MAGSSSATTPNATPGILSGSVYPTIASLITRAFEVSGLQNSAQMDILSTPSGRNSRIRCKGGEDTCCFRVGYERYKDGEKKVVTTLVDLGHSTQCKRDATGLFVAPDAPESAASAGNKGKQAEVRRSQPVDSGSEPESLHGMNTENAHDGAAPASPPAAIVRKTIAMINPQARRRAQQLASNAKPSAPVPPPTAGEVFSSLRTLERRIADAHFDGDTDKLLRIVDEETDTVQITCDWEDECTFVYLGKAAAGSEQYYRVQKVKRARIKMRASILCTADRKDWRFHFCVCTERNVSSSAMSESPGNAEKVLYSTIPHIVGVRRRCARV